MRNRLKELRKLHQWSQSDLARALGVSRQAVNGFESSKFDPSLDMAFKIANLFNVAIEHVFIYETKNTMQVLAEQVKNFFGFEFGFERFTEDAINVFKFARNEAVRLNKSQVEPEHLLAGLLADSTTTAARLLRSHGVTLDLKTNEYALDSRENLKFSPQSKFVLELALQVVRLQGNRSIGTEHLLWGLVRLSETSQTTLNNQTTLNKLFGDYEIDCESLNRDLAEIV